MAARTWPPPRDRAHQTGSGSDRLRWVAPGALTTPRVPSPLSPARRRETLVVVTCPHRRRKPIVPQPPRPLVCAASRTSSALNWVCATHNHGTRSGVQRPTCHSSATQTVRVPKAPMAHSTHALIALDESRRRRGRWLPARCWGLMTGFRLGQLSALSQCLRHSRVTVHIVLVPGKYTGFTRMSPTPVPTSAHGSAASLS